MAPIVCTLCSPSIFICRSWLSFFHCRLASRKCLVFGSKLTASSGQLEYWPCQGCLLQGGTGLPFCHNLTPMIFWLFLEKVFSYIASHFLTSGFSLNFQPYYMGVCHFVYTRNMWNIECMSKKVYNQSVAGTV